MQQRDNPEKNISPKFATYFHSSNVLRKNFTSPITPLDVENHIAEALWRAYDSLRREAALRLNILELDLGICDIRVIGMGVDGNKVMSIEGFDGRTVQITLMITLCSKADAEKLLGSYETGVVKAKLFAERSKSENIIYAEPANNSTSIFSAVSGSISHAIDCPWSPADAAGALGNAFGANNKQSKIGELIYSRLLSGQTSEAVSSRLNKIFGQSFQTLINGIGSVAIKKTVAGAGNPVMALNLPLPESVNNKNFVFGRKKAKIVKADMSEKEAADFISKKEAQYTSFNEGARRRVKWLINK